MGKAVGPNMHCLSRSVSAGGLEISGRRLPIRGRRWVEKLVSGVSSGGRRQQDLGRVVEGKVSVKVLKKLIYEERKAKLIERVQALNSAADSRRALNVEG
ncbi:putative ribosomal protein L5 [Corchorus olitorius]|uniref:Ribosomal protein L5 n=1 Tax=Corchorus olitorius TaxID=93759 RepID=A0A1R3I2H5_9ROSI|nr:putative ribosomal protein L5 [Corchorus olitorius]